MPQVTRWAARATESVDTGVLHRDYCFRVYVRYSNKNRGRGLRGVPGGRHLRERLDGRVGIRNSPEGPSTSVTTKYGLFLFAPPSRPTKTMATREHSNRLRLVLLRSEPSSHRQGARKPPRHHFRHQVRLDSPPKRQPFSSSPPLRVPTATGIACIGRRPSKGPPISQDGDMSGHSLCNGCHRH